MARGAQKIGATHTVGSGMTRFWKYQIRYRLARRLIHAGLFVMPEGRYKIELVDAMWALYDKVAAVSCTVTSKGNPQG